MWKVDYYPVNDWITIVKSRRLGASSLKWKMQPAHHVPVKCKGNAVITRSPQICHTAQYLMDSTSLSSKGLCHVLWVHNSYLYNGIN